MKEQWKQIPDFPYEVSNTGQVRRTKTGRILQWQFRKGYAYVCLCVHCQKTNHSVHVLVAEAFIPNPQNLPQVNHKDLDKMNCAVDNLEWATAQQNHQHALATGLWNKPHKAAAHIYWRDRQRPWYVVIQGKHQGSFFTHSAAMAVRDAILKGIK